MRARISLIAGEAARGIVIPREAVLEGAEQSVVYVQEGGSFTRQVVTLGPSDDRSVEVVQGLLPGDQVVVEGNRALQFATNSPPPPSASPTQR
jgi:multidrug efflux pump subunit AcrA (membrane-fusion protein)